MANAIFAGERQTASSIFNASYGSEPADVVCDERSEKDHSECREQHRDDSHTERRCGLGRQRSGFEELNTSRLARTTITSAAVVRPPATTRSATAPTTMARARPRCWEWLKRWPKRRRDRNARSCLFGIAARRKDCGVRAISLNIRPCRSIRSSRRSTST